MRQVTVHLLISCVIAVLDIPSVVCSATAEDTSTSLAIAENSSSVAVAIIRQRCIQIVETVQSVALSCTKCTEIVFYFNDRNAAICKETWLENGYFEILSLYFPMLPVFSIVVHMPAERKGWQLQSARNILGNATNDKMVVIWLESANAGISNHSKELTEPWHHHFQLQLQTSKIHAGTTMLIFTENRTKFKVSTVTQNASIILLGEFKHELVNVYRMLRINSRTMVKTFLFSWSQDVKNLNNAIERAGRRYSHIIYRVNLLSEKLASDLQGNSIRVAGVINGLFNQYTDTILVQLEDGSLEFRPSFAVDTLESLQLAMNFNTIPIKANSWGYQETVNNVTRWKGVIQLLIDQEADLGISSTTDSISRREVVKYLFPTSTVPIVVFFKSPGPNNQGSLSQPFQLQVWVAILLWTLVVCLLLVLILRRQQERYITADIFQQIFSIFSLQYFIQKPIIQITLLRIVMFTGFLMAVVLSSAYVGGLFRFLSSDDDHVKTFKQLEAKKFKVGLVAGNLPQMYLKLSNVEYEQRILARSTPLKFKSLLDIKYRIMNGSFIMVAAGYALVNELTSSEMCATRVIPFERKELSEGPIVPKDSQLKRIMDYQLIKFYQVGLVNRWRSLYLRSRTLKPYCSRILAHLEFPAPVPVSTITMALGILGFGFGLALFSIAVEFMRKTIKPEPPPVLFQYLN